MSRQYRKPPRALVFLSFAASVLLQSSPGEGAPSVFPLEEYRTPISPGTLAEDTHFLADLLPVLSKEGGVLAGQAGNLPFESIDVRIERWKVRDALGNPQLDDRGREKVEILPRLVINGENFRLTAMAYMNWRRNYENAWIAAASGEIESVTPTVLQQIFNHPGLTQKQKIQQTAHFYLLQNRKVLPAPTPNPRYWPLSPIMEIESLGAQVQFNTRGGHVVVLREKENKVWKVPFPVSADPDLWLEMFEATALEEGIDKATEVMRQEALQWGP